MSHHGITYQLYTQQQQENFLSAGVATACAIHPTLIYRLQYGYEQVDDGSDTGDGSQYDYTTNHLDACVQAVNASGGTVCLALQGGNAPSVRCTGGVAGNPPTNEAAALLCANIVKHFLAQHITIIMEYGNEDYWWKWNADGLGGTLAGEVTIAVYTAVKAVDATILVGSPSAASLSNKLSARGVPELTEFYSMMLQATYNGIPFCTDWLSYHSYGEAPSVPYGPYALVPLEEAALIRSLNEQYLPTSIFPIWLGETGYALNADPAKGPLRDHTTQAAHLKETMKIARESQELISVVCWYTLAETDAPFTLVSPAIEAFHEAVATALP